MQKPAGELLRALLPALRAERRPVTQRALSAAVGALARCASAKRLEWLVTEVCALVDAGAQPLRALVAPRHGTLSLHALCAPAAPPPHRRAPLYRR
jgi:hypothetical protein